ncbi:MAG: cytochrome c oxidase subunit II [candidate division Zixibacteria bacterium]|nr:cytochrome c oxidase subunit II [candidate division Zixibacteria bacterium]
MDTTGTLFMPSGASTISGEVDAVFNFILIAGSIIFAIVVGLIIFFSVRYRRRDKPGLTSGISHNLKLELTWTIIPVILVFFAFYFGFKTYLKMSIVPGNAIEIKATGQKWFWSFDYPEGVTTVNELVVPVDQPVKVLLSSQDVIHSFFVPNFRIKMDVLPNRYTVTWFEAHQKGEYNLFCAEYCGTEHSEMVGKVRVVSESEYQNWLEESSTAGEGMTPAEYGAKLYISKSCNTCHSIDGTAGNGPSFKNIFGKTEKFADGSQAVVDENYLRESILEPANKIVAGYQNIMPTYQGLVKDREIDALIAYMKTLSNEQQ